MQLTTYTKLPLKYIDKHFKDYIYEPLIKMIL